MITIIFCNIILFSPGNNCYIALIFTSKLGVIQNELQEIVDAVRDIYFNRFRVRFQLFVKDEVKQLFHLFR